MNTPESDAERKQRTHKKFLSIFLKPMDLDRLEEFDNWSPVLGEPLAKTCDRLVRHDFLKPANLSEKIAHRFNGNQLKQFLKDRGLPVSGKKAIQAERLVEADSATFEADMATCRVFLCTEKGTKVANAFLEKEMARENQVCAEIREYLEKKNVDGAITKMRTWDNQNVFPKYPVATTDFSAIKTQAEYTLQASWPGLHELPDEMLNQLRIAATMWNLMRSGNPLIWIPDDFPISEKHRLEDDLRSIGDFVSYETTFAQMTKWGGVKIVCGLKGNGCASCVKLFTKDPHLDPKALRPWRYCSNRKLCDWLIGPETFEGDSLPPDPDPDPDYDPGHDHDSSNEKSTSGWNIFSWWRK